MRADTSFALLALCFGLLFLLSTPPGQVPDGQQHFFHAYQLSTGQWLPDRSHDSVGGILPRDLATISKLVPRGIYGRQQRPADILELALAERPRDYAQHTTFIRFPNMALNVPFLYLPQALGITIGERFGLSVVGLHYLARLFNLLVWTAVMLLAVRAIPMAKWLMMLIALTPMSLFLATSTSADALVYSLCFLFVGTVMRHVFAEGPLGGGALVLLLLLCIVVTLTKIVYIALLLLLLLIPRTRFASNRRYAGFVMLCFGVAGLAAVWWSTMVLHLYVPGGNPGGPADPEAQIGFILSNPKLYLSIVATTVVSQFVYQARLLIGVLGWLDTPMPPWLYVAYYAVIPVVSILDRTTGVRLDLVQKSIVLAACAAGFLLVLTSLYLKWTPVGSPVIIGVQGRYFIPLSFLFWLLLYRLPVLGEQGAPRALGLSVTLFCTVALSFVSWLLLNRYYLI
jgi:uncharacterized membrane protein